MANNEVAQALGLLRNLKAGDFESLAFASNETLLAIASNNIYRRYLRELATEVLEIRNASQIHTGQRS
jgi:hypothetical protein